MKRVVLVAALICFAMAPAFATSITGTIGFTGTVGLDTTSAATATAVTSWNATVQTSSLSAGAASGAVTFAVPPWNFASGGIAPFWQVSGYTFDLSGSHVQSQGIDSNGLGFVTVVGTGIIKHAGFDDTTMTWSFTTQDPRDATTGQFTFSTSQLATPEPGSLALFSAGLIGLGGLIRRRK